MLTGLASLTRPQALALRVVACVAAPGLLVLRGLVELITTTKGRPYA